MCFQVIELEPQNEQNYYKRFRVYLRMQKNKEALQDLSSALAIKPAFEQALSQRAKLGLRMGRCTESVNDFRELAK
jgi:tetratricopeptide (TPR) repeat protein